MTPFSLKLFRFSASQNIFVFAFVLFYSSTFAQLGPGGVSHETPNTQNPTQSDVRLWLDAGSLVSHADGDPVDTWNDISLSAVNDKGFRSTTDNFLPPYFRDDPSASINGYPVVTFEDGRMLKVNSSADLNSSNSVKTTYEQTIILAFRTSEDVTSRQVLWEEGGGWRGMNLFIFNGELYLGAYDNHVDNDINYGSQGKVPKFGYNYVKTPLQPNTTYVISHVFDAPTDNSLNGSIRGYRNGSFFGSLINGGPENGGIGGIFKHPDAIGIGAVNSDTYNETGSKNNITGQFAFKGRLAEICYYNRLLNDAERIIVENYLGAKYYANIIVNDRYEYQSAFGTGVIGIGQTTNSASMRHTVSQGLNPFEISAVNENVSFNAANEFLMCGHNGLSLNLTDENVPNDVGSTQRSERIWRFDESGELLTIKFRFHEDDLLPLPTGFTKHVLIFDNVSANFANFSTANSEVIELNDVGGGFHEAYVNIADGAFMTLGVLKPQVSFSQPESFGLESNPAPDSTGHFTKIFARLNFVPTSSITVDISFADQTALRASDYGYLNSDVSAGITFPQNAQEIPIRVWVKNDGLEEDPSTESFAVNLFVGPNTTSGLGIGEQSQHIFTIYDDDPPPKLSFAQASSAALENVGSFDIDVVRTGSTVGSASARVKIINGGTTADDPDDFSYPSYKTVNFSNGESVKSVSIDIASDDLDEENEFIQMRLYYIQGAGSDNSSIINHNIEIIDDDLPPSVEFTSQTSQNYETNGNPAIFIELEKPSAKDVTVTYTKTENLATAATYGADYGLAFPATITIQAGDTLGYPSNLIIQQDGVAEPDETIEFELTGASKATLGLNTTHVYTIKDYSSFEWKGVAGVGKDSDNIFWLDINKQSGAHDSKLQTITNFSPHNIDIYQNNNGNRAVLKTTAGLINNNKTLRFDGTNDYYTMANSGLVNLAPKVGKKSYFMVIRTGPNVSNWQTVYKQGGSSRGFNIYIRSGSMYFNVWNNPNDGAESQWGSGAGTNRFARFDGLQPNTNYIVSCLFDKDATQKIRIYINGVLGQKVETGTCGFVYSHSGAIGIGGANGSIRYHDNSSANGRYFNGSFAEMIHFTDAPVNETRRKILENYFSGRYNIALGSSQIYSTGNSFSHEIAGLGKQTSSSSEVHTDSQGSSILRIKSPSTLQTGAYLMWGHNNVSLDESWPWSGASLPIGVVERSGRVWRISKTGNVNGVELLLRYSELQNATNFGVNDLKLLIHDNSDGQDFSNATLVNASELKSGYVAKFNHVNLSDGQYFALANTSSINPLPIELISFAASYSGDVVDLTWTTASEINNETFVVERAGTDLRFTEILTQPGAGNSNSVLNYWDTDHRPLSGMSYYRLKQIDYDGDIKYSDPISVYIEPEDSETVFSLYPNPVVGNSFKFHKSGALVSDEPIQLMILDLTGKTIIHQWLNSEVTNQSINLPSNLGAGVYLVRFRTSDYDKIYKIVINR